MTTTSSAWEDQRVVPGRSPVPPSKGRMISGKGIGTRSASECLPHPEIVIAGCGNPLFADDGFGPAVIEKLQRFMLPDNVKVVDAGVCGSDSIFTLLDPRVTKQLIVIDLLDFGASPGSITRLELTNFPQDGIHDALPGGVAGTLRRVQEDIPILIVGCQPKHLSYPEMEIGLSDEVQGSIPRAVRVVMDSIGVDFTDVVGCGPATGSLRLPWPIFGEDAGAPAI